MNSPLPLKPEEKTKIPRKSYSSEFKQQTASLALDQVCSRKATAEAMGIGCTALDHWVRQLRQGRNGETPEKGRREEPLTIFPDATTSVYQNK
ncbi:MAG: transposase [Pseudomonadota bacterium]